MTSAAASPRPEPPASSSPVLACPACKAPLDDVEGSVCPACGVVAAHDGTILNFIGAATYLFSPARDRELAAWLVDNAEAGLSALKRLQRGEERDWVALALGTAISPEELQRLDEGLPLEQIISNVGDYRADVRRTSPTIEFLIGNVTLSKDSHLLDAGCSAGRHLLEWSRSGARLTGLDFRIFGLHVGNALWPERATSRPTWIAGSVVDLPLASGLCSHVVSSVVLGLVPARRTLAEFWRVLQPGGRLVLTVEGPGFLSETLDHVPLLDRRRLGLMRWWLARKLMERGVDWQESPRLRRLSSLTQFTPALLRTIAGEAGFRVERVEVLSVYRGAPRLVGIVARKAGA